MSRRRARPVRPAARWLGALLVTLAVCYAGLAHAQLAHDYDLTHPGWNGLSEFAHLARSQDVLLTRRDVLHMDRLDPSRPLIILQPAAPLNAAGLQAFVSDGGRLLLADDIGGSDALLQALSSPIERVSARGAATTLVNDNPNLPVIHTPGRHDLLEGKVEQLVANHPAAFRSQLPAVVYFDRGQLGFVYDLTIGSGKILLLGDPSLFINLMLGLDMGDNRTFATNALAYVCGETRPCEADLYVGEFTVEGAFGDDGPSVASVLQKGLEKLNELPQRLEDWARDRRLMRVMTLLLSLGLVLFGLTLFPFHPPRFLSIRFRPPARLLPRSEFERNLQEFAAGRGGGNYALPIAILRDEFERLFLREVFGSEATPDNEARYRPQMVEQAAKRFASMVAGDSPGAFRARHKQATALMRGFARVPARAQIFVDPGQRWNVRDLMHFYTEARDVLEALNVREEYEQRTRRTT